MISEDDLSDEMLESMIEDVLHTDNYVVINNVDAIHFPNGVWHWMIDGESLFG